MSDSSGDGCGCGCLAVIIMICCYPPAGGIFLGLFVIGMVLLMIGALIWGIFESIGEWLSKG